MDRETISDCYRAMTKVEKALDGLRHRDAVPAIETLNELRGMIGEELPGGFFGRCAMCDGALGCYDSLASTVDGEWVCETCCHEAQETTHD